MVKLIRALPALLVLMVAGGAARFAAAADAAQPVAVISFAGYEQLGKDLELVGTLAGNPGLKNIADASLKLATLGKGLSGLDESRPWGVAVMLNPMQSYGFVPVSDLKELAETVATMTGKPLAEVEGAYKIDANGQTLFAKQQGKWALIGILPDVFVGVPTDPAAALATLPKQYSLAVSLRPGTVPAEVLEGYVSMALGMLQMQPQLQGAISDKQLDEVRAAIKDLDEVTIGLGADGPQKKVHLDVRVTAKAGSKLAAEMAADAGKSRFAGLAESGSAVAAGVATKVSASQIEQKLALIDMGQKQATQKIEEVGLPEASLKLAKQTIGEFFDVARATCKLGRNDAGLSVALDEKTGPALLAGGILADGAKLEGAFKKAAQLASDTVPDASVVEKLVKFNAETYQGFRFHKVTVPLEDIANDPEGRKLANMLGDKLLLILAISDDAILVGAGKDPTAALKSAIDKSQGTSAAGATGAHVSVALLPIARFAAAIGDPPAQAVSQVLIAALSGSAGKDHVNLTLVPVERGCRVRLELEEGVIKAIGVGVKMSSGGGAPPAGGSSF